MVWRGVVAGIIVSLILRLLVPLQDAGHAAQINADRRGEIPVVRQPYRVCWTK